MEIWITVVGLFIGGNGETFYVNWSNVESFGMNDDSMKIRVVLSSGKLVHWSTKDREFYDKVKDTIYREVQTTVMFSDDQAKIEVDCGK